MGTRHKPTYRKCTGTSKRTGKPCLGRAMLGMDVCYFHGGATPRGEASPNFLHGGRSGYMPQRLAKIYEASQDDTNLLQENIRLRETFLREKLALLDEAPESAKLWKETQNLVDDIAGAYADNSIERAHKSIIKLQRVVDERNAYFDAVSEISAGMNQQRADKQAIAQIEFRGENAIPARELMALMGAVLHVIQSVVTDKQQRVQVADGIDHLIRGNASPARIDHEIESVG